MRWADDLDPKRSATGPRTSGLGTARPGGGHVARRGLTELESEALEACGRGEYEHTGWFDVDRERVGDPARSEHEGSLVGFEDFIAHVEGHLPVEDRIQGAVHSEAAGTSLATTLGRFAHDGFAGLSEREAMFSYRSSWLTYREVVGIRGGLPGWKSP
jgi:hypothetical protein